MRNIFNSFLFLSLGMVLSVAAFSRTASAADLFDQQLQSYSRLYEDQSGRKKKAAVLQKEMEKLQARYDQKVSKISGLSEKALRYVDQMDRDARRIRELEEEIETLHGQAVAIKDQFWKDQEGYAASQKEYAVINARQEQARKEIMRLMESRKEAHSFLDRLDQRRNRISSEAERIYQLLLQKQAEYEKIFSPVKEK